MYEKKKSQQGEGAAPSDDIGWRFANAILGTLPIIICAFCDRRTTGGITKLEATLDQSKRANCTVSKSILCWSSHLRHLINVQKETVTMR